MHYDDQNYRLPTESRTPMLQVTHGCSYNKCNYCSLYYKTPFAMSDRDEILADIDKLASSGQDIDRVYLMNGDPFTLPTEDLVWIIDQVQAKIPTVKSFSMFASVLNVQKKTDKELRFLREKGITDLYMGSESFHDPSLKLAGVGYTAKGSLKTLKRLDAAGIGYSLMMILGLAGSWGEDRASEIGKVNGSYMSQTKPLNITITTLFIPNNSVYGRMRREGNFKAATEREKAMELKCLFENLDLKSRTFYYSYHGVSSRDLNNFLHNYKDKEAFVKLYRYYNLRDWLPDTREEAIQACQGALESLAEYPELNHYPWSKRKEYSGDKDTGVKNAKDKKGVI